MLIALLIMSLAGAGLIGSIITTADIELLSQRVETVISNPEHAAASQQILAEVKTEIAAFDKVFTDSAEQLRALYEDHAADSAQVAATFDALNADWYAAQQRHVALRARLKQTITPAEWGTLFEAR